MDANFAGVFDSALDRFLRVRVARHLEVRVNLIVDRVQDLVAALVGARGLLGARVRRRRVFPRADARENVRRHVQRVRRRRRDLRVRPRGGEPFLGERRKVVAVDQEMRDARMVRILRQQRLEELRRLERLRVGLIVQIGGEIERERVEDFRFDVLRILRDQPRHRFLIGDRTLAPALRADVGIEERGGVDIVALALRLRADRFRFFDRGLSLLQEIRCRALRRRDSTGG